jgi:hypothetical protein
MTSLLHTLGTVSVENGSTTVTGDGTGWVVGAVKGGVFSCRGLAIPIDDVPGDEELLIAYPWPGQTIADQPYAIALTTAQAAETTWVAGRLAEIVTRLSLSGIVPDGAGSLAERNALDPVPANGFTFLRVETGHDLELYRKVPSGWDGPFPLRGGTGAPGADGDAYEAYGVSIYDGDGIATGGYYADRRANAGSTQAVIFAEIIDGDPGAEVDVYLDVDGMAVYGPFTVATGTPVLATGLTVSVSEGEPVSWVVASITGGAVRDLYLKSYGAVS